MNFNRHLELDGLHSFMSPSNYHWLNYSPEKLVSVYKHQKQKEEGTILHQIASDLIGRRLKMANLKKAFNMFVNDAIGYRMESEVVLYYSRNCFGTADAISFKDKLLRIHDLKTGVTKPSFKQLIIYAALFCLEYAEDPNDIQMELRLYQGNGFEVLIPEPSHVQDAMDRIEELNIVLENYKTTL